MAALLLTVAAPARAADPQAVARGAYLAAAAGCDLCHTDTEHGGAPYAGGRAMRSPYGTLFTPNITPDKATGIGTWSAADFTRAMRGGVAPDDSHFVPLFPFTYYAALTDADLADLKAFLDSVAPVNHAPSQAASAPALAERAQAAAALALSPAVPSAKSDPAHDAAWNKGAYLVATIGRCGDCHTPRDRLGRPRPDGFLAGTASGSDGKKVPNITQDDEHGIGKWSEDDIVALLKDGQTPDMDFVGGSMAEIVKGTARLTDADRGAIASYLKTVPGKSLAAAR